MAPEDPKVRRAVVHRPSDSGVDLPAGKSAGEIAPSDYRAVEIDEEADEAAAREASAEVGRS